MFRLLRTMSTVPKIALSQTESQICQLLKDYTSYYNATTAPVDPLVLRITGGWVRDKLLGKESNDLDIAINQLSGEEFAEGLNKFLSDNLDKYGLQPKNIHKIEKNPEKSKHLETATTKLYGLDIDFVNLRSEEYTQESRIPVIRYGTPEEDALRRDATLNAMFYNIQQGAVEDLTGRGLQDLRDGCLRTPLEPLQTFLDDPLRVLRLIRFAARFNFTIDADTLNAMRNDHIKEALLTKISKERIGVELEKTLTSANPSYGIRLMAQTGLADVIFDHGYAEYNANLETLPEINEIYSRLNQHVLSFTEKLAEFSTVEPDLQISFNNDAQFQKKFYLAAITSVFGNYKIIINPKKAKSQDYLVDAIIKDGLKVGKLDSDLITKIIVAHPQYCDLVNKNNRTRSETGLLLRQFGDNQELAYYINYFLAFYKTGAVHVAFRNFAEYVQQQKLCNVFEVKPLIDGKELCKALEVKPGKWMTQVNNEILTWQLDNPQASKNDVLEYVKTIIGNYI